MEKETIEVRKAAMTDGPILSRINLDFESAAVYRACMEETDDFFTAEFQRVKLPKRDDITFQRVAPGVLETYVRNDEVIVATIENRIVGYLHLDTAPGWHTMRLALGGVPPIRRRNGIGTALLKSAESIAAQRELKRIAVMIQAKNEPAIRFIRKNGYAFSGYEEFYFPNLEIALIFTKMIR